MDGTDRPSGRRQNGNLPPGSPGFVGRATELAELGSLVVASRLVTVTGAGGVGKTRTAIRAAELVRDRFPDGVWLVNLSQLHDEALLAHTVARALELQDQTTRPMVDVLADYLTDRRCLLVLDDCEHLVDVCALLAEALLDAAPGLRILATSRQPLEVKGEAVLPIAPLAVPAAGRSTDEVMGYDAVRLFADRATAADPAFAVTDENHAVVARVCRRLDGLPLALELAAALARHLPVDEIAAGLDDRFRLLAQRPQVVPGRHETLRATIGWSHELCTPAERLLWARVSVFAGTFTLVAAQEVCAGGPLPASDVPRVLAGLAGKSIVLREEGHRYRMLDTIREYGAYWLRELGQEHGTRLRHRDHYLAQARRAFPEWIRSGQVDWYERILADYADVRVALETCLAEPDGSAVEMTGALWFFWFGCGFQREGRRYLERALAHDPAPGDHRVRAQWAYGCVVLAQGDLVAAAGCIDDCRRSGTEPGDPTAVLAAGYLEGTRWAVQSRHDRALAVLGALRPSPELGVVHESIGLLMLSSSAFAHAVQGDFARAAVLAGKIRAEGARRQECSLQAWGHYIQAVADLGLGDGAAAARHARAALEGKRRLRDNWGMALVLDTMAMAATAQGEGERAARLLGVGRQLWLLTFGRPQFGSPELIAARRQCERAIRAMIGDAAHDAAFHEGLTLDPDTEITRILATEGAQHAGDP